MRNRTPLTFNYDRFDLKMLLAGGSGSGKTRFCGTYTKGPIHFYMLDAGGELALDGLPKRPDTCPISWDNLSVDTTFQDVWELLQKDQKEGLFEHLAEVNGLAVLPDSYTALAEYGELAIGKLYNKTFAIGEGAKYKISPKTDTFTVHDWGQLTHWNRYILQFIRELPCAVASTVHVMERTDAEGKFMGRAPAVTGRLRDLIGNGYHETYYMHQGADKIYYLYMEKHQGFQGKSRAFDIKKMKNPSMDLLADLYMKGKRI